MKATLVEVEHPKAEQSSGSTSGWGEPLGKLLVVISFAIMTFSVRYSRIYDAAFSALLVGVVLQMWNTRLVFSSLLIILGGVLGFFHVLKNIPTAICFALALTVIVYVWWTDRKAKGKGQPDA